MVPLNLYVVRHFHSEGNQVVKMDEENDSSGYSAEFIATHSSQWRLSREGRSQAEKVNQWFKEELLNNSVKTILVSPYIRTIETAILTFPEAEFTLRSELIERNWGDFERMTIEQREKAFNLSLLDKSNVPFYWQPPNGESIAQVTIRAREILGKLHRDHSEEDHVVIVAHGEFNQALDSVIRKISPIDWTEQRPKTKNGQVLHYSREDENGQVHKKYVRWRSVWPINPLQDSLPWQPIQRKKYSVAELTTIIDKVPHLFTENN
jgi:2,3-bisphosphoglycerate-dependent phosphoglycerate mutase